MNREYWNVQQAEHKINKSLRNVLNKCESDLSHYTALDNGLPELMISNYFRTISYSIECWTEQVFDGDTGKKFRAKLNLQLLRQEQAGEDLSNSTSWHMQKYNTRALVVVSSFVWSFPESEIFDKACPIGLNTSQWNTMCKVQDMMKHRYFEPDHDLAIATWRSKGLSALCASGEFKHMQDYRCQALSQSLRNKLARGIDGHTLTHYWPKLEQNILAPAVKLHQILCCSKRSYQLYDPRVYLGSVVQAAPAEFDYKNVKTWDWVRSEDVGALLEHLSPALVRLGDAECKDLTMVKAVFVVQKWMPEKQQPLVMVDTSPPIRQYGNVSRNRYVRAFKEGDMLYASPRAL